MGDPVPAGAQPSQAAVLAVAAGITPAAVYQRRQRDKEFGATVDAPRAAARGVGCGHKPALLLTTQAGSQRRVASARIRG
jgi:hypothetical protein